MTSNELLSGIVEPATIAGLGFAVTGLALDSRKVEPGFVFIALSGAIKHGLAYVEQALKKGAVAVIYEARGSESFALHKLPCQCLKVNGLGLKLGAIAARFYRSPSTKLDVIGITGTNGKTTCSQFLLQLMPACAAIGTLGWGSKGAFTKTLNTTPNALELQALLANFVASKKKTVALEVSSHGLQQGRVNGVNFKGALFTNLSRDHLDYHKSMEAYCAAKLLLFKRAELQFAVVNADDANSTRFLAVLAKHAKTWAYSITGKQLAQAENVTVEAVEHSLDGSTFTLCWQQQKIPLQTKIVGDFNLENMLAVSTVLLAEGYRLTEVASKVSGLLPICGRMEQFGGTNKPRVVVDFAHTPAALERLLEVLKSRCQGKLWLVFGCGGERDRGKRAKMGEIAASLADAVVITSDNPRFEDPAAIIKDIQQGCQSSAYEVIQDRAQAIQSAIQRAAKQDCVVVAGKGHEDYQEINGVRLPLSDQHWVQQGLLEWS